VRVGCPAALLGQPKPAGRCGVCALAFVRWWAAVALLRVLSQGKHPQCAGPTQRPAKRKLLVRWFSLHQGKMAFPLLLVPGKHENLHVL
jgi:hypothetical protein